jgi:hypothetical protein
MCYTYQTSINAFIIGSISSLACIVLSKGNRELLVLSLFFFFVLWMQIFDAIFWSYPTDTLINRQTTMYAMFVNHLQPIVLALLIYFYIGPLNKKTLALLLVYILVISVYTIQVMKKLTYTTVTQESSPSLYWSWNHGEGAPIVYALFLITLIVLMIKEIPTYGTFAAVIKVVSFVFSYYKYQIKGSTGRFWCYFAAFAPMILLAKLLLGSLVS